MSTNEEDFKAKPPAAPAIAPEDTAALSWLGRWLGIPLLVVIALFYAEFLFGGGRRVEVVDSVLKQTVTDDYPFPPGTAPPTNLAPPPIIREHPVAPAPLVPTPPMSSAEVAANPIDQPQPAYPQRALEAEKEGSVRMHITIGPDGSVLDATVVSARPSGWFESAAINAVKRWRYQPSGRTIATDVEIEFKMK